MKTLILFLPVLAFAQSPIIPIQPGQQISASFENLNRNDLYLDGKSTVCIAAGVNVLTCPGIPVPRFLYPGLLVALTAQQTNSAAVTLNIAGLGAKPVRFQGGALTSGVFVAGNDYMLSYNGTVYNLLGGGGSGPPPASSGMFINVKDSPYNAHCNGAGDDHDAFNAAITVANAAGGGIVTAPGGVNCRITTQITLKSNVTLQAALGSFTVTQATSNTQAIDVGGTANAAVIGVTFSGGIIANAGFTPTTGLRILNNTVQNATSAIPFGTGFYSSIALSYADIAGNTFHNTFQGMQFATIKHVQIRNNTCNGLTGHDCVYATNSGVSNADTNSSIDVLIEGNIGTNLWRMGAELQGWYVDAPRILHNSFTGWNPSAPVGLSFGISLASQGTGGIVGHNTVIGTGTAAGSVIGIEVQGPAGSIASDNSVTGFVDGIQMGLNCPDCSSVGNSIYAAQTGINVLNNTAGTTHPIISFNHIFEAVNLGIFLQDNSSPNAEVFGNIINRTPTPSDTNYYGIGVGAGATKRLIQNNTITIAAGAFPGGATYSCIIATANVPGSRYDGNDCINANISTTGTLGILCNSATTELNGVFVTNSTFKNLAAVTNCTNVGSTALFANNKALSGTPASYLTLYTPNIASGASNPPLCTVGDIFFLTTAGAGSNLQDCTATNTWTAQGGGGGGGSVTSIATTGPITGGTITTTGTIACATCLTGTPTNHGVAVGTSTQANGYTAAGTTGNVLTSNGASADPTFQVPAGLGVPIAVTTNKTLVAADILVPQEITGTVTISAPASLTGLLTAGWAVPLRNLGTGTITVSGNGFLINGQANQSIPPCAGTPTVGCPSMALSINAAGTGYTMTGFGPGILATGTAALGTSAISSATCAAAVTVAATGALTTDDIAADFNGDPTAVTGYAPSASGMLAIIKYPTSGNVNFKVCNNTAGSITPGAITLNWRVIR